MLAPVSALVLTRILGPEQYGVLGAVAVVVALASRLAELRFTESLVPRPVVTGRMLNTALWVSLSLSSAAVLVIGLLSGQLAGAIGVPQAASLMVPAALPLVIDAVAAVHATQLRRSMRLTVLAWADVVAAAVVMVVAVLMARAGFGPWSIVSAQIAGRLTRLAVVAWASPHAYRLELDVAEIGPQLRYGLPLLLSSGVASLAANADRGVISRLFDLESLGHYDRAQAVSNLPVSLLAGPLMAVVFPYLSRELREGRKPGAAVEEFLKLFAVLALPFALVSGVAAVVILPLLLGERWAPIGPITAMAIPLALVTVPGSVAYQLYTASGRTERWLLYVVAKSLVELPVSMLAARGGPAVAAFSHSLVAVVTVAINLRMALRLLGDAAPLRLRSWHFLSPLALGGAGWAFWYFPLPMAWSAPLLCAAGCLVHAALVWLSEPELVARGAARARELASAR